MKISRLLTSFLFAASYAFAIPVLFNGWGAGQFGLVAATPTVNLNGTITGNAGNIQDGVIAVNTGVDLALSGGTVTGAIDFADAANKTTGGTCPADAGGTCRVNANSAFTGGTVTGVTVQSAFAVTNAINEWNTLYTGWGGVAGVTANLGSGGGAYTLCAGSTTGCTTGNTTPVTQSVNGMTQTAYVFDISSTAGAVNHSVTIKGDGTALVILIYNNATTLNINQAITLTGGITADQVLLDVTSAGGIITGTSFNYAGALAVKDTTETLQGTMSGRLYLGGVSTANVSSFNLTAPADLATPEPATELLIGGALVLMVVLTRKRA
ncbi:MAG TPA: hypothetical protein VMH28_08695 [Candidatus Acidoferrales bacterium]|nr:hypothetical protein [Candidatus Acidoferrales bacterium]